MMRFLLLMSVLLCAVALAGETPAQPSPADGKKPEETAAGGLDKDQTAQLLEQVMLARISRELSLDDEQTVLIVRHFADYRETARELRQQRGKLLRELNEALRKSGNGAGVEERVRALLDLDVQMAQEKARHFDSMSAQLTPWQRGKLYSFFADFEREFHRMIRHAKEKQEGERTARPDAEKTDTNPEQRPAKSAEGEGKKQEEKAP